MIKKKCILPYISTELLEYHRNRKGSDSWDAYLEKIFITIKEKDELDGIAKIFKR